MQNNKFLTKSEKNRALAGAVLLLLGFALFKLTQAMGAAAQPIRRMGAKLGNLLCRIWGILPFPIAEWVWLLGVLSAVGVTAWLVYKRGWRGLIAALCHALLAGGIIYFLFSYIFLTQYSAPPLEERLGLEVTQYTADQLARVTERMVTELNRCAEEVLRDEKGMLIGADYKTLTDAVGASYMNGSLTDLYIRGPQMAPKKAVLFSDLMGRLSITGYYFPITGESIVSGDLLPTGFPFTIAHEAAHAFGIGLEKDANFAAFLCCIEAEEPEVRYSGLLNGYVSLHNALYRADHESWERVYAGLSDTVRADLARRNEWLRRYEGPLNDLGSSVNNAYIQSTGQPDGVKSYGRMVDLIIAWYLQ